MSNGNIYFLTSLMNRCDLKKLILSDLKTTLFQLNLYVLFQFSRIIFLFQESHPVKIGVGYMWCWLPGGLESSINEILVFDRRIVRVNFNLVKIDGNLWLLMRLYLIKLLQILNVLSFINLRDMNTDLSVPIRIKSFCKVIHHNLMDPSFESRF